MFTDTTFTLFAVVLQILISGRVGPYFCFKKVKIYSASLLVHLKYSICLSNSKKNVIGF
jgi:hypothetical protein